MLADNVSYFKDDFLMIDATDEEDATDNEIAKQFGGLAQIGRRGDIKRIARRRLVRPELTDAVAVAAENYRKGMITAETVAEFALGEMIGEKLEGQ
jgi:hypothetical protein